MPQTGYIVSNVENLLGLFDADFGILVIGEGAKILGPNQHGQEILIMAEYLRLKQYKSVSSFSSYIYHVDCYTLVQYKRLKRSYTISRIYSLRQV